jgi:hypothetical protein
MMYFEYAVYGFSIVLCAFFSFRAGFNAGFQDGVQGAMEHLMSDEFREDEESDESSLMRIVEVDDDGNETKSYFKEF